MTKPGWGAVVLGDRTDVEDWAYVLQEPFDPWVEVDGTQTVLRSASLDELGSASEVRDRAVAQIERLNGAVSVSQGARPLRFGGVIQFASDGRLHTTVFAEGSAVVRAKVRATATVSGPDGKPVPPAPPQASANASRRRCCRPAAPAATPGGFVVKSAPNYQRIFLLLAERESARYHPIILISMYFQGPPVRTHIPTHAAGRY
jgi:hypothetical protein